MTQTTQEKFGCNEYGLWKDRGRFNEKGWAFSILSDVQEMVSMGLSANEINDKINKAKRVLRGQYTEIMNGFSIEVN
jgi:hypothetical protein